MKKVLIVGAGVAGLNVIDEIKKSKDLGLKVVGLVDDDPRKLGKKFGGFSVIGGQKDLKDMLKKGNVDEIIIAIPSARGESIYEYVKTCSDARVAFRIVPRVKEIIEGRAYVNTLRKVRMEDLLGRPVIKADVGDLKSFFKGKTVLVTGAAGSIGSELSMQIAAYYPKVLIAVDQWEGGLFDLQSELSVHFPRLKVEYKIGDIYDREKVSSLLKKFRPNYVFHAAAYKHVPLMETNPEEAVKNNIIGTENVAIESKKTGVERFVFVSTDKAANPKSVMGATKILAEKVVMSLGKKTRFMVVRFGNVLGSFGSVIPTFRKQIEEGGPVTVTDKRMTRYFMTVPEAAQLILKAGSLGKGGELFVLDMGEPVKVLDLAERMIRLSGYIPGEDIEIKFVGKRKGEKLHEKLFTKREELGKTREEKIFISESTKVGSVESSKDLEKLKKLAKQGENKKIRKELGKLIPGFKI